MSSKDDSTAVQSTDIREQLEALREELDAWVREPGARANGRCDDAGAWAALVREIERLRCAVEACSARAASAACCTGSSAAAPAPPYPPFPPYPPYPPVAPFPPYPPYPPNCGCCAPAPCGCAKCSAQAAPPAAPPMPQPAPPPQPTATPSSSSSSSSSGSSWRLGIRGIPPPQPSSGGSPIH